VLDEPTNHLDLWACDALQQALRDYPGTVLLVSHDRYFVDQVADHLLVVEPDRVRVVEGNYETYRRPFGRRQAEAPQAKPDAAKSSAKADKPRESTARKRRFPYRKVADLEAEIFEREGRVKELQQQLARGDTHRDAAQVRSLTADLADEEAALKTLYEHWDEATELNW
jgi:ATP-binding cassette subfamily F protein 3